MINLLKLIAFAIAIFASCLTQEQIHAQNDAEFRASTMNAYEWGEFFGEEAPLLVLSSGIGTAAKTPKYLKRIESVAAKGGSTFFEGAKYSDKVLHQMSKADDIYHAFPKSVDGYATKFGQWSTKLGDDGKPYEWLKMPGSYGGKTGVFEYTKDANGLINHRFFNVPKVP